MELSASMTKGERNGNKANHYKLAQKATEGDFAREMRIPSAIKLYEMGRLSSGRAAELAGMRRIEFLFTLEKYKVFPLESELCDLEDEYA